MKVHGTYPDGTPVTSLNLNRLARFRMEEEIAACFRPRPRNRVERRRAEQQARRIIRRAGYSPEKGGERCCV